LLNSDQSPQWYDHLAISLIAHLTSGEFLTGHPDKALGLLPIVVRMISRLTTFENTNTTECRLGFAYDALLNITAVQCSIEEQQRVYEAVFDADGLVDNMLNKVKSAKFGYYIMGALANICRTDNPAHLTMIAKGPKLFDVIKSTIKKISDVEEHAPEFLLANLAGGGEEILQLIINSKIFTEIKPLYYLSTPEQDEETPAVCEANRCSKIYVTYSNAICSASSKQLANFLNEQPACVSLVFSDISTDASICDEFATRWNLFLSTIRCIIQKTTGDVPQRALLLQHFKDNVDCLSRIEIAEQKTLLTEYHKGGEDGYQELCDIFDEANAEQEKGSGDEIQDAGEQTGDGLGEGADSGALGEGRGKGKSKDKDQGKGKGKGKGTSVNASENPTVDEKSETEVVEIQHEEKHEKEIDQVSDVSDEDEAGEQTGDGLGEGAGSSAVGEGEGKGKGKDKGTSVNASEDSDVDEIVKGAAAAVILEGMVYDQLIEGDNSVQIKVANATKVAENAEGEPFNTVDVMEVQHKEIDKEEIHQGPSNADADGLGEDVGGSAMGKGKGKGSSVNASGDPAVDENKKTEVMEVQHEDKQEKEIGHSSDEDEAGEGAGSSAVGEGNDTSV
jgi:hypothetical protein